MAEKEWVKLWQRTQSGGFRGAEWAIAYAARIAREHRCYRDGVDEHGLHATRKYDHPGKTCWEAIAEEIER